jgi:hypothetical protein
MTNLHFDLGELIEGSRIDIAFAGLAAMKLVDDSSFAVSPPDMSRIRPRQAEVRSTTVPRSGRWHLLVSPAPDQQPRGCSISLHAPVTH